MSLSSAILINEKDVFVRISHGDEAAFADVFYHYTPRIHPFVKKITRSEELAEEIVQDVFVSLWKNREKLADVTNCSAYIFTIASNKALNYLKARAREANRIQELARREPDVSDITQETIDLNERRDTLNKLIDKLTPQKRLIYQLTREGNLSHEEIASRLNISKNTVKNHLVETLKFLRKNLVSYLLLVFL